MLLVNFGGFNVNKSLNPYVPLEYPLGYHRSTVRYRKEISRSFLMDI